MEGTFGLTVSIADRIATRTSGKPQRVRKVDRVLQDVDLFLQRRRDVDGGVGDDQRLVVRRHVHHEAVADAPRRAQARVAPDDGAPSARRCAGCLSSAPRPCPRAPAARPRRPPHGCAAHRRSAIAEIDADAPRQPLRCARAARRGSARSARAGPPRPRLPASSGRRDARLPSASAASVLQIVDQPLDTLRVCGSIDRFPSSGVPQLAATASRASPASGGALACRPRPSERSRMRCDASPVARGRRLASAPAFVGQQLSSSVSSRSRSARSASSAGKRRDGLLRLVTRDDLLFAANAPPLIGRQSGR